MIIIHWDFSDGTEISYKEGLDKLNSGNGVFNTHCLDFFSNDIDVDDVIVLRKDGKIISRRNIQLHTQKEIRQEHNLHKMLVAESFNFI